MSLKGTIYNIQRFSIHDGPGIRTTVFMKGCPLTCWWCHNPESRSPEITRMNGKTIGKRYDTEELMGILLKDTVFYDESGGGVTFSGGEPLEQSDFLTEMLRQCQDAGIHTAIDTCGSAGREVMEKVMRFTDLFLYDLKLMDGGQHIKYTSKDNGQILENLKFLLHANHRVWVRVPLIPGITNTADNLLRMRDFLAQFSPLPEVYLLPYHRTAEGKYEKLNMPNRMAGIHELSPEEIEASIRLFEASGYPVTLG